MKPIKLGAKQLRNLIVQEARKLHEGSIGIGDKVRELIERWESDMCNAYDASDPSMAAGGEEAWQEQCIEAAVELQDAIDEVLEAAEAKLVSGDHWRGPDRFGH